MKYNGWTNYETWQAQLWLYDADIRYTDAELLEDVVRDLVDADSKSGLDSDIFNGWISCVNFHEIASNNEEDAA